METYSTKVVLSVVDNGFTSKMNKAAASLENLESKSQKASGGIMNIMKGAGAFKVASMAADTLKASLDGAISRFDTMNQFPKVMQQIGFSAEQSEASIQKLSDGIQGVPTSLDEITASTQKLALLTGDLEKATDASLALNNAFYASGASSADASRGLVQYTQMLSKGTVDIVSWRTLQETMGVALNDLAETFGYAGSAATTDLYAAIQSGQITFDQLNDKLIELDGGVGGFAERAKTASAGIGTSFTNMGIAVTRGMEGIVRSTNDALTNNGLPGFQEMVENTTSGINKGFSVASDGIELLVGNLDVLVPTLGTAAAGFIAYKAAMDISDRAAKFKEKLAEAADTLNAIENATRLTAEATTAQAAAVASAEAAEGKMALARKADMEAIQAQSAAKKLSVAATKAQVEADKQAKRETQAKKAADELAIVKAELKAAQEEAAAAATKSRAIQEKAAAKVTKAQAKVDSAAANAAIKKAVAEQKGASASTLSARAEKASMVATEAASTADKKAAAASVANAEAERMESLAATQSARAEAMDMAATAANTKAAMVSNVAIATKTALLGFLSREYTLAEAGQLAWNAAMAANPIGTVIVAATALVAVVVGLSKALEKLDTEEAKAKKKREDTIRSSKDLVESLESTGKAYDETVSDIKAQASANDELVGKIENLSKKESRSTEEKAELQSYVEALNSSMEDLNLQYDAENDALSMSTDQIKAKVAAYKEQAEAQAAQERYTEVLKEQMEVAEQLKAIQDDKDAMKKRYQDLKEYTAATSELTEQEEALNEKKKELAASEEHLTGVMEKCQTEQTEAVRSAQEQQKAALAESIANQTVSLGQLSEANQETVSEMKDQYQDLYDKTTNVFEALSDEQTMTIDEMIENAKKNKEVTEQWGSNMESLRDRFSALGLDEAILDQLQTMSVDGAGYVATLASSSDEKLSELAENAGEGGKSVKNSYLQGLGADSDEIPAAIQNMFAKTETSLRATVEATDWSSIGNDIITGYTGGIDAGVGDAYDSGAHLGEETENGARDATQTHSPSALFKSIGQDLVAGLAQGLMDSGMATEAAVQMADNVVRVVQEAMDGADFSSAWIRAFSGISNVTVSSMSQVTYSVKSGMSVTEATISAGTAKMQSVMNAGMNSTSAVVKTGMASMVNHGKSGMEQFNSAVKSGMGKAKASTSSGVSGMVSALSQMQSRFYSSGYYASLGLASGINAGSGAAIAAANRVASQVAATMDKALKVGSPSRVTRKTGRFATEGFVLGLLDDIRQVRKAAASISRAAVPSRNIENLVSYAGNYTENNNLGHAGENGGTYTIVVPFNLNAREFARATATYTKEELDRMEKFENLRKGYR